ncbi:MAG: hypothetical protein WD874_00110 [Parcubacteria group bacterium]
MNTPTNFKELIDIFIELIRAALPVIFGLALLVFLWGLAKFIFKVGGDEKAVEDGKNLMKWGIIALFILVSFWSILALVHGDLGFGAFGVPFLPPFLPPQ